MDAFIRATMKPKLNHCNYTNHYWNASDERYTEMLETIITWTKTSKCPATFNSDVVYGIKEFSESSKFKGYSERQKTAIENIYESFRLKRIYGKK